MTAGKWHIDRAENRWLAKSQIHTNLSDGTYPMIDVPRYTFIHETKVELISPYGNTSQLTLGYQGNGEGSVPEAFLKDAEINPDGTIIMRSMLKHGNSPYSAGKYFNAHPGSIILVVVKGNAASTAAVRVWMEYSVIHS